MRFVGSVFAAENVFTHTSRDTPTLTLQDTYRCISKKIHGRPETLCGALCITEQAQIHRPYQQPREPLGCAAAISRRPSPGAAAAASAHRSLETSFVTSEPTALGTARQCPPGAQRCGSCRAPGSPLRAAPATPLPPSPAPARPPSSPSPPSPAADHRHRSAPPPPPPPGPCSRPKPPFRSPCRGQERTLSGEGRARRIHLPAAAAAAAPGPGPGPGSAAPAASRPGLRCRAGVCAGPAPPRRSAARTATMATPRRSGDGAGSAHGGAARGGSSARTAGLSVRAPREPLGAGLAARTLRLDPGDTKQPQPGALGSAPSATRVGGSEGGHHVPAPEIAPQPTSKSKFT